MRKRNLRILNIDGVEGVGKTTQLNIIAGYLKKSEIPIQLNKIDETDESISKALARTEDFLKENPDGIVINDGTIANTIVQQLSTGNRWQDIENRHKDHLFHLECLNHTHGTANILLVPDNLETCDARLRRRQELFEQEVVGVGDTILQQTLMNGLMNFDNSVLSRNLKFHVLKVYDNESIMQVHKNILNLIDQNFVISNEKV